MISRLSPSAVKTRQPRKEGWKIFFGLILILFFWLGLGNLPAGAAQLLGLTDNPLGQFFFANLNFLFLLAGLAVVMWGLHFQSLRSLIFPTRAGNSIDHLRLLGSALVWLAFLTALYAAIELISPGALQIQADWSRWLTLAIPVLILTPLQALAEELFFRGYLLRGLKRLISGQFMLILISALIFASAHFITGWSGFGAWQFFLSSLIFGIFTTRLALYDKRLEIPIGIHVANNLFFLLVINGAPGGTGMLSVASTGTFSLWMLSFVSIPFLIGGLLVMEWLALGRHTKPLRATLRRLIDG